MRPRARQMKQIMRTASPMVSRIPPLSLRADWRLSVGRITVEDAETGEQVALDTSRPEIREAYSRLAGKRQKALAHAMRANGVDLLALSTHASYLPSLLSFFRVRERRKGR